MSLSPDEREHWLERLRGLIERFGPASFVAAPIVEPTDRFFPDHYTHWLCDHCSGEPFDTFATRGRCPSCGHQYEETFCPVCGAASPHEYWWPEGS
ncbi:MAG TPA: hypothetical protein VIL20_16870 [Sandaracinaceae bacterium]